MKRFLRVCRFAAIILLAVILLRIFVGEPCCVPSDSMSPAVLPGDRLWIDRTAYGARLPERWADMPIINAFTWIRPLREADRNNCWGYRRFPGYSRPKIGDAIVFNSPENTDLLLVKRIVRVLPGGLYYVEGDNRANSVDSRTFGCVPERNIVGRASCVLFSIDSKRNGFRKLRTNRVFRKI